MVQEESKNIEEEQLSDSYKSLGNVSEDSKKLQFPLINIQDYTFKNVESKEIDFKRNFGSKSLQ